MISSALLTIWDSSEGDYVFLPTMRNGVWTEGEPYTPEAALNALDARDYAGVDAYFSPLKYVGSQRRKGMLGKPGVIYADMDGSHDETPRLLPSIVVTTSKGHYHGYWLLDQPAEAIDWEGHAKAWSKEIGADPGGWDATQVLRVPGTTNMKYNTPVSLVSFHPDRIYTLDQFPTDVVRSGSVAQAEPVPSKAERDHLIYQGIEDDRLPLSARYWLTADEYQIAALGKIDRSKIMWQVELSLVGAGYTAYEIFHLMFFSGINKFRGRPDRLWYEVNKAADTS